MIDADELSFQEMVISAKTKKTESTCLHMAAAEGYKGIVRKLLENGADRFDENSVRVLLSFSLLFLYLLIIN